MAKNKVRMPEAKITDEMLEDVRKLIGTRFRIAHAINNEEATRIAILKYAEGIGDGNPLWINEEYAESSRYGAIVAPPSWIFSVFSGIQYGFRGVGGFHSSSDIDFYMPVLRNDKI